MAGIDKSERTIKELFIGKCWAYLDKNFSKFSQANKIKIAMELCKKSIPTELTGEIRTITQMPSIQINGEDLEINIG